MAISKKSFVNLDLQGNSLVNPTIGLNSNMTKEGSFQYNAAEFRLEYFNGTLVEQVANLSDIAAVTGGLIFQGGYDPTTNTPDITVDNDSVKKGFFWVATVAGTFLGENVQVGDSIIAKQDNPAATAANWLILQGNVVIATDTVDGIVRLATQTEVNTGTEGGAVVVTPATLQGKIDAQITPEINNKLPLAGGTMTGNIDMNGNNINNATLYGAKLGDSLDAQGNNLANVGAIDNGSGTLAIGNAIIAGNQGLDINGQPLFNVPAPTNGGDAANKDYVDGQVATALPLAGGTMSGGIDMGGNNITNAGSIVSTMDVVAHAIAGSEPNGLLLNTNLNADDSATIVNLPAPTNGGDAANKTYVDTEITTVNHRINDLSVTGLFYAEDWTLTDGIYTLNKFHNLNIPTPKVACYVSGQLVEFGVLVIDNNNIQIQSNITPPAEMELGITR